MGETLRDELASDTEMGAVLGERLERLVQRRAVSFTAEICEQYTVRKQKRAVLKLAYGRSGPAEQVVRTLARRRQRAACCRLERRRLLAERSCASRAGCQLRRRVRPS